MTRRQRYRRPRFRVRKPHPGAPSGTLVVDPQAPPPEITAFSYGARRGAGETLQDLSSLSELRGRVLWVNLEYLGDAARIEAVGRAFGLHPLSLEDVIHASQQAKTEFYAEYLYFVCRMILEAQGVSQRMNEVVKVLIMMATIFVPLTFVAGIYGMNFNPERSPWTTPQLNWYRGYPFALGLMGLLALGLLVYFRRRGWL